MAEYLADNQVAARLTAAVNSTISSRPADPMAAMVRLAQAWHARHTEQHLPCIVRCVRQAAHLKEHAGQSPPPVPTPEPGAKLLPEVDAYLTQHKIHTTLDGIIKVLVDKTPADPIAFLAERLQAWGIHQSEIIDFLCEILFEISAKFCVESAICQPKGTRICLL